jgi:hemerythrin
MNYPLAITSASQGSAMSLPEVRYRRYRIVWDVRPQSGTPYWTGKVAVVGLSDGTVQKSIQRITEHVSHTSEEETRQHLIVAAKAWIDNKLGQEFDADPHSRHIILWNPALSVGIEQIDRQHQELIGIINSLIENEDATGHSEPVADVLDRMTKYADYHFNTEEDLMSQHGFPGYISHRDEHTRFKMKTAKFCLDALQRKETLPDELFSFLRQWLTHHILQSDMQYKPFLLERGIC